MGEDCSTVDVSRAGRGAGSGMPLLLLLLGVVVVRVGIAVVVGQSSTTAGTAVKGLVGVVDEGEVLLVRLLGIRHFGCNRAGKQQA